MRRRVCGTLATLAAGLLHASPVELHGFVDSYWYSANVSRGKIPFDRPILFQEIELDLVTPAWGSLNAYYAPTHSLTGIRDEVSRRAFMEDDLLATYSYAFSLAEDWQLKTRVGYLWILTRGLKPPYRGNDDATGKEFYTRETLVTPYVNGYLAVHARVKPYHGVYFKTGLTRTFPLVGGFSLTADAGCEGGDKDWNRNRYGERIPNRCSRYRPGPVDLREGLTLNYELAANVTLSVGIHRFDLVLREARRQTAYRPAKGYRSDLTYLTAGIFVGF